MELINIPNRIYELAEEFQLSVAAQAVLWQLCGAIYRRPRQDTAITISHASLATRINASPRTVARGLAQLEQRRIITRERRTDQHGHFAATCIRLTIPARGTPRRR